MTPEVRQEFEAIVALLSLSGKREFMGNIKTGHVTGSSFHTTKVMLSLYSPHKLLATTPLDTEDCGCAYGHLGYSLAGEWGEEARDLAHQEADLVRGERILTLLENVLLDHVLLGQTDQDNEILAEMLQVLERSLA